MTESELPQSSLEANAGIVVVPASVFFDSFSEIKRNVSLGAHDEPSDVI